MKIFGVIAALTIAAVAEAQTYSTPLERTTLIAQAEATGETMIRDHHLEPEGELVFEDRVPYQVDAKAALSAEALAMGWTLESETVDEHGEGVMTFVNRVTYAGLADRRTKIDANLKRMTLRADNRANPIGELTFAVAASAPNPRHAEMKALREKLRTETLTAREMQRYLKLRENL